MIGTLAVGASGTCVFSGSFCEDIDRLIEDAECEALFRAEQGHQKILGYAVIEAHKGDLLAHRVIDVLALEGVVAFARALEAILGDA